MYIISRKKWQLQLELFLMDDDEYKMYENRYSGEYLTTDGAPLIVQKANDKLIKFSNKYPDVGLNYYKKNGCSESIRQERGDTLATTTRERVNLGDPRDFIMPGCDLNDIQTRNYKIITEKNTWIPQPNIPQRYIDKTLLSRLTAGQDTYYSKKYYLPNNLLSETATSAPALNTSINLPGLLIVSPGTSKVN